MQCGADGELLEWWPEPGQLSHLSAWHMQLGLWAIDTFNGNAWPAVKDYMATATADMAVIQEARVEAEQCGDVQFGEVNVAILAGYRKEGFITSKFRVRCDGAEREVWPFWYDSWPVNYFIKFRSFRPLFLLVHSGRSLYRPWGASLRSPRGVASQKSSET